LQHRQSRFAACARHFLERRLRGWNKDQLVEPKFFARLSGKNQMAVMNRIERSAVDTDFSHSNRFFVRTVSIDI